MALTAQISCINKYPRSSTGALVGLVGFNDLAATAKQTAFAVLHGAANAARHEPRGFISAGSTESAVAGIKNAIWRALLTIFGWKGAPIGTFDQTSRNLSSPRMTNF